MESRESADKLCVAGNFPEALEHYRRLESESTGASEKAGYLVDQATCHHELGNLREVKECITRARELVKQDRLASAQIDYAVAIFLLEEEKSEQGLQALSQIVQDYMDQFNSEEGRKLYERIQVERAFTLMHLSKNLEARPLLEKALAFELECDTRVRVHCHLGCCYHELSEHQLASEQFRLAQTSGVPADWEAVFHYYFGYTLFEQRDFAAANREFILCLQSSAPGPSQSLIYKMLATTSRKLGDPQQARLYDRMARSS